jgi:hypothetical protein
MVLGLPFAHIPSHFAEDRRRGHHIDAVDLKANPNGMKTSDSGTPLAQETRLPRCFQDFALTARAVVFLASDDSGSIAGTDLF